MLIGSCSTRARQEGGVEQVPLSEKVVRQFTAGGGKGLRSCVQFRLALTKLSCLCPVTRSQTLICLCLYPLGPQLSQTRG